jgi:hypothetical protein
MLWLTVSEHVFKQACHLVCDGRGPVTCNFCVLFSMQLWTCKRNNAQLFSADFVPYLGGNNAARVYADVLEKILLLWLEPNTPHSPCQLHMYAYKHAVMHSCIHKPPWQLHMVATAYIQRM